MLRFHARLLARYGPQHWWLGRTPFEIAVGAILVQHTAWTNVERALRALRARRLLTFRRLAAVPGRALPAMIRPAGTPQVKAERVRAFLVFVGSRLGGRMERLRAERLPDLRAPLLGVPGIGPETADAILLYAGRRPVFVADSYARRVLERHRLIPAGASYEALRALFEAHLPADAGLYAEFHALLIAVGKRHCRAVADCQGCPLRWDLHGRPPRAT